MIAETSSYLQPIVDELLKTWPGNRTVNFVCHGHSVPSGYFATPVVDSFQAYPHLWHRRLKARFPFAVINVIVTAIGGESSDEGALRFERDVLNHRPDVITIDYALNDRRIGLDAAERAHRVMIEAALAKKCPVLLLGPTPDLVERPLFETLKRHDALLSQLAAEYEVGYVDVLPSFEQAAVRHGWENLMSWANHPNGRGHELVAEALMRYLPF